MSKRYRLVLDSEQNASGYGLDLPAELMRDAGFFPGDRLEATVHYGRRGRVVNLRRDLSNRVRYRDTTSDLIARYRNR
jgi:hypothetical protein